MTKGCGAFTAISKDTILIKDDVRVFREIYHYKKEVLKRERETKVRLSHFDRSVEMTDKKKGKPPYSYVSLIVMAILESPSRRQTLSGIIEHIQNRFPYYGDSCPAKGWKNSIRHNLSLNDCFVKTFRDPANPSKGHLWCLHPQSAHMFEGGSFMRRKKRFRKKPTTELEESCVAPHANITLKTYRDIHLTSFLNVTASALASSDAPVAPCSIIEQDWNQEHSFKQQTLELQTLPNSDYAPSRGGPGISLLSFVPDSTLCLVCAGCTCYYP